MSPPALVTTGVPVPRRRVSALSVVAMVLLGLGALVLAALVFAAGGPVAGSVTIVLAAVSFPLLIWLSFWLDRYEPEPLRYRLAALGWGGIVATALGGGLTALVSAFGVSEEILVALVAPITEEFAKGLFLGVVVLLRRRQMHGLLDGIVYAALTGIGFAFVEDILYYLSALAAGGPEGLGAVFFLRGVMSPFAHPLFTAAIGVGVGIAVLARSGAVRVLAPLGGYLVAVALHALWNGSGFFGGDVFLAVYALIMLPLVAVLIAVGVWARYQEGRLLTAALTDVAHRGWLPHSEIRWAARMPDRIAARRFARRTVGRPAARLVEDYQRTLVEIAFLHHRVLHGTPPADAGARMQHLLGQAAWLRPYVALPGNLPGPGLTR